MKRRGNEGEIENAINTSSQEKEITYCHLAEIHPKESRADACSSPPHPIITALRNAIAKWQSPSADPYPTLVSLLDLNDPSAEKAKALLDRLPDLLPDDPAMAAVLADAMAAQFGEYLANSTDANGNEHAGKGEGGGQFVSKGEGGAGGEGERKIHAAKSSPKANDQAAKLGYRDVGDMFEQAKSVTASRVSEIQDGYSGKCKAHEAIAVISEDKPFKDAEGNTVHFGNDIIEHYVEGRRRKNNEPKVSNLEDLPYAIKAFKSDSYGVTRLTYPDGTTQDPLNPPRGTQREYHINTDRGQLKVFVYIQGGVINGWHVKTNKTPR